MVIIKSVYTKPGATFADGESAKADRNQFFPADLLDLIRSIHETLITDGILVDFPSAEWDQSSEYFFSIKEVSNVAEYTAARTWDTTQVIGYAEQAGWTYVEDIIIQQ